MKALSYNPLWFATRATGTMALVLLTLTVMIGIAAAGRYAPRSLGRFEVQALHRNLSILTVLFLIAHILTSLADTYVPLGWISGLVPFLSPYRTVWVGLGTVAFDLLLAVALSSAVRTRLGGRRWKAVHWLAYGAWPVALFHAAGTGTDTKLSGQLTLFTVCVGAVVAVIWWRLYRAGPGRLTGRLGLAAAAAVLPALLYAFLTWGPLAPHWSHRAAGPAPAATTVAPAPW